MAGGNLPTKEVCVLAAYVILFQLFVVSRMSVGKIFVWHAFVLRFGMSTKGAIILIEYDLDDQQILRDVLQDLGVKNELLFFGDCYLAFNHLMSLIEKPFLIICDINLPKMDGIELKQKIDATDHLRRKAIPFVFLTTSDSSQTIEDAYRVTNLQGYFQKSNTMAEIRKKIKLILDYWTEALHPSGG